MERPKPVVVALGGIVGAIARWAVFELTDHADWALIAVNSLGSFLLGALIHGVLAGNEQRRLLLGVGFCGALTTFSTFAVDIAGDLDRGAIGAAFITACLGLAIGLAAGAAGIATRSEVR